MNIIDIIDEVLKYNTRFLDEARDENGETVMGYNILNFKSIKNKGFSETVYNDNVGVAVKGGCLWFIGKWNSINKMVPDPDSEFSKEVSRAAGELMLEIAEDVDFETNWPGINIPNLKLGLTFGSNSVTEGDPSLSGQTIGVNLSLSALTIESVDDLYKYLNMLSLWHTLYAISICEMAKSGKFLQPEGGVC